MRRGNKRRGIIVLAVLVFALVVAAGIVFYRGSRKETVSLDSWYCPSSFGNYNYSNDGMFYYGNKGISYLDAETGKEMTICTKAGCKHEDETCPAKVEALYCTGIVYDGSKLYYVSSSGEQEFKSLNLTQCDVNGENRKKLADFPEIQTPEAVAYYEDFVIVAYYNGFDVEKREEVNNREAGIYVYNRRTKKGKKIYYEKAWNNWVSSLDVIDGELYFCRSYSPLSEEEIMQQSAASETEESLDEVLELYRISLDGGEAEYIADEISVSVAGVTGIGDMVLYSTADGLQAYFPETKEKKTIREGKDISLVTSHLSKDIAVFQQGNEDDTLTYYLCDKNGSVKKIGDTKILLQAVYDDTSYGMGDDGWVILETKKWQQGDFECAKSVEIR